MPTEQELTFAKEMHAAGLTSDADLAASLNNDIIPGERLLSDETIGEIVGEIVTQETREAIYAAQDGGVKLLSEEDVAAADAVIGDGSPALIPEATTRAKKVRAAAKPKAEKVPGPGKRISRVATSGSLAAHAAMITGEPTIEGTVNGMAKKIQEKAVNYLDHVVNGKVLSVYTKAALDEIALVGSVSSKRLIEILSTSGGPGGTGYSVGTARSQAQQVMSLLPALFVCSKTAGVLTPIEGARWAVK